MDEQEFRQRADEALNDLNQALIDAGEKHEFEADFSSGALTVEFEDPPTRFVVSPNAPVRQIWVSALSKSYKLDWDAGKGTFVLADSGETLNELLARVISQQIGQSISL